jgi:hypothetical protein
VSGVEYCVVEWDPVLVGGVKLVASRRQAPDLPKGGTVERARLVKTT